MNEELVTTARDCLRIKIISLRESHLTMHADFLPTNPGEWGLQSKISLKNSISASRMDAGKSTPTTFVRASVEAGVRIIAAPEVAASPNEYAKDDTFVCAELVATFVAEYDIEDGKKVPAEALNEFLTHNAVYHVWSYWREYVQSTFSRALLPHVTLPMMVITPSTVSVPPLNK